MKVPRLALSYGQVAWALNLGQDPPRPLLHRLNYFRQCGIPHVKEAQNGLGSGNRVTYDHTDLVECGVALAALQRGMKLADVVRVFVEHRPKLRGWYRKALTEQPESALQQNWVRSRGREIPLLGNELQLIMSDRYADEPGQVALLGIEANPLAEAFHRLHQTEPAGLVSQRVIPLTRLVLQWTAWALEAPHVRPGPKSSRI